MKAVFFTFGCKLNQCETEALASYYKDQGFLIESFDSNADNDADLYIINTCTVTSKSEQKARRIIRNISRKNPQSAVIVTGCYAQLEEKTISSLAPNVLVIPQSDKAKLFELAVAFKQNRGLIRELPGTLTEPHNSQFRFKVDNYQFHSRAFCKIQDGCNYRCSYCRVPLARGKSQSLDPETVINRITELEKAGYREIVLTGVNICSYEYGDMTLVKLLQSILAALSTARIRLSSLEPEMVTEELADVFRHKAFCPHFHLPVQSGSDKILQLMRRRYMAADVTRAVDLLRRVKPGAFISGDIIVGFPGETAADFQLTKELIVGGMFAGLHIFPFSARPGTAAFSYKNKVPERIKKERSLALQETVAALFREYVSAFKGKNLEIILEKKINISNSINWQGLSANYLKVEVPDNKSGHFTRGALMKVKITEPGEICKAEYVSI